MQTGSMLDNPVRLFIAEDHKVVLRGLEALLKTEPDVEVIGSATDGVEALAAIIRLQPDVLLLDLQLPGKSGLQIIPEVRAQSPQTKIVILTSFGDDETIFTVIKAGALSYLLKDSSPDELMQAIRDAHEGKPTLPADIAVRVIREINQPPVHPDTRQPLTGRELEVLRLVAQGLTNQEIADKLVVGERTVRTHVSNILAKLRLANRTQAALYALREGYTTLDD
jgi:NarL family two-component system response regulator LiaR